MNTTVKIVLHLFVFLIPSLIWAQNEVFTNEISGGFSNGMSVLSEDDKFYFMESNPSSWQNSFTHLSVDNKITLYYDPTIPPTSTTSVNTSVTVEIKWKDQAFQQHTTQRTLQVEYHPDGTIAVNDRSTFYFKGGHWVEVKVLSTGGSLPSANNLLLRNEIIVQRGYPFAGSAISGTGIDQTNQDYLTVFWTPVPGATHYELEYVHINDYTSQQGVYINPSMLQYDFYKNSTRVEVYGNTYQIPRLFDHGYFIYRVRGIGKHSPNYITRKEGAWNAPESGTIASLASDHKVYIQTEVEQGTKNWVHSVGFTEEGKRFESIGFADGLGRGRQQVARNTVTNQVVVSNVYYDYHGRPVVSDLGTPVDNETLRYFENFNRPETNPSVGYSAAYFDLDTPEETSCIPQTTGFALNSGSGKYYSTQNPSKDRENAYIPDAAGFPFARIQYMPDQTGRIKRAGGYGEEFQLGMGHETEFFYVIPSQEELNLLFGTDVGIRTHYQKRVMRDANGQHYVEYYDMAGRVIASGMLGEAPSNLDELEDVGGVPLTFTILEGIDENNPPSNGLSKETQHVFFDTDAEVTFNYSFTPQHFSSFCQQTTLCFDCIYELTITVKDDCGDVQLEEARYVNGSDLMTMNSYALDDECASESSNYLFTNLFTVETGVYVVTKELRIAQEVLPDYWCMEADNGNCNQNYFDFFNAIYTNTVFDVCEQVYEQPQFNPNGASCADFLNVLKTDVSPNGQYGQYQEFAQGGYVMDPSLYALSVFNDQNSLGGNWRHSSITYYESDGVTPSLIEVTPIAGGGFSPLLVDNNAVQLVNGSYYTSPQNLLNFEDFIGFWQSNWANELVQFHPEYCYYEFCISQQASHDYDANMFAVLEQQQACADHWYNPLGLTSANPSVNSPYNFLSAPTSFSLSLSGTSCTQGTPVVDPFFQSLPGSAYHQDMLNDMSSYVDVNGVTFTMLEIAMAIVLFPDMIVDPNIHPSVIKREVNDYKINDPCLTDQVWLKYVELYQAQKKKYFYLAEQQYALENGCYNGCFGNPTFNGNDVIDHNNGTYNSLNVGAQPCDNPSLFAQKTPRFQSSLILPYLLQSNNDLLINLGNEVSDLFDQFCQGRASDWLNDLIGCNFTSQQLTQVEAQLQSLCSSLTAINPATNTFYTIDFYQQVHTILVNVLGSNYASNLCSPYLINKPALPSTSTTASGMALLDDCGCDKLMGARYAFVNNPSTYNNPEHALNELYGIYLRDVNELLCVCDMAFDGSTVPQWSTWTPQSTWTSSQLANLVAASQPAPSLLSCTVCIGCADFTPVVTQFNASFAQPITEQDVNYSKLFTNYMNNHFDFSLQYGHYTQFLAECGASNEEPTCELSDQAIALTEVLNLIARRGQLLTPSTSPVNLLNENIVYNQTYGLLDNPQLHASFYTTSGSSNSTLNLVFENPAEQVNCTITLTLDENAGFGFEHIIGFSALQPLGGENCVDNGDFSIQVQYISCGQIVNGLIHGNSQCVSLLQCSCGPMTASLCSDAPALLLENMPWLQACYEPDLGMITYESTQLFEAHMEAQRQLFYAEYMTTCALAFETEKMDYTAPFNLYQHTLFYYDQAGNLIKTVAPEGRDRDFILATTHTQTDVNQARLNGTPRIVPDHKFITTYHYNSYNQLIKTTNPDQEGDTRFWYDFYGRIAASQNPHQADLNIYSYTLYDEIGRPVEVGQLHTTAVLTDAILKQKDKGMTFQLWVANNGTRTEVTRTQYDAPLDAAIEAKFANGQQENLRMRVASVMHYENYPVSALSYQSANHYSYDIHGNVKEVIQDFPFFGLPTQDISTQYEYELISGNMKKVSYQKEKIDQLTHQYTYDDLNRLVDVYSSTDDIHYHREASYTYYDYGPLARKEIGSARVQGQDFTYTLNGWLKGMNSNTLDKTKDPGKDGTVYPSGVFAARNERVAKDVVGFSLGYYGGDYSPIGGNPAEAAYAGTAFGNGADDLFNGNIRHMVTAIEGLDIQGYAYRYDQLQRIKQMQVYRASDVQSLFAWTNSASTDEYKTTFTYDRNGNLLSLNRNGIGTELDMDRFVYNYHTIGGQPSNRLNYVVDNGTDYSAYDDIKSGQTTGNYTYNKIGELIEDASEDMELEWRTGDHKLLRVIRTDDASPNLTFIYNPFGQRIMKIATERANGNPTGQHTATFYAYDANGQVMAVYEVNSQEDTYKLKERHLYGAERLGINSTEVPIYENNAFTSFTHKEENIVHTDERGHKRYELTNHLGNVLAVINDRKIWNATDGNYEPVMLSWSDFYAFGMQMPGRNGGVNYRYLFNGMEHDGEVSGNGNSYTTEFRQYDPRLGRWKSLDPLLHMFPWMSPYVAFDNNPVYYTDPLGLAAEGGDGHGEPVKTGEKAKPDEMKDKDGNRIDLMGKEITVTPTIKQQLDNKPTEVVPTYDRVQSETTQAVGGQLKDPLKHAEEVGRSNDLEQQAYLNRLASRSKIGPITDQQYYRVETLKYNLDLYGNYVPIPGVEILAMIARGEDITANTLYMEGIGLIPAGKLFSSAGRLFLKFGVGDKAVDVTNKTFKVVCFVAGTKISTTEGLMPIEEIQIGDLVWAFDEETGDIALKTVYNTVNRETDHLEKLIIGSDTLYTTSEHPFWVSNTWKPAGELVVGDTLTLRNNDKLILNYKEKIDTVTTVYNFAVSEYATYYVGEQELLVHNNGCAAIIKTISKTDVAEKVYKKLSPSVKQQVDKSIAILKSGAAGGNQHPLKGDLKGFWAIDVKGSGKGRGGLRIIYEKKGDSEIIIHNITDYH